MRSPRAGRRRGRPNSRQPDWGLTEPPPSGTTAPSSASRVCRATLPYAYAPREWIVHDGEIGMSEAVELARSRGSVVDTLDADFHTSW